MNEELQQALTELVNMIKGGLNQLPPFLKQLTDELTQHQFMSSLAWIGIWGVTAALLASGIWWLVQRQIKDNSGDGIFGMAALIAFSVWILLIASVGRNVSDALQARYAPTSVLIEYLVGQNKGCGK